MMLMKSNNVKTQPSEKIHRFINKVKQMGHIPYVLILKFLGYFPKYRTERYVLTCLAKWELAMLQKSNSKKEYIKIILISSKLI